ncbi:nuclear transport factor 2 family protein [Streptomyces sp. NPDC050704]|uniref:nuclear transport factor 2 family protein n=1 Tax=Streptomyces sp. NPDC050704 TaxID=3157219 RepID=UPI003429B7D6
MSWTRGFLVALAVCALLGALFVGATSCGSGDAREGEGDGVKPSPVGKVLEDTDEEGRNYREIDEQDAPDVAIEIHPDAGDNGWDVRLTVHDFRFSPAGTKKTAEPGRGYALLRLDGRPLATLRDRIHHIAGDLVPRGTHQITVRLHADDDTVWAVDGKPVGSTADITASEPGPTSTESPGPTSKEPTVPTSAESSGPTYTTHTLTGSTFRMSVMGTDIRTGGRGSPDPGGKAS